jgi:hypothetical protein
VFGHINFHGGQVKFENETEPISLWPFKSIGDLVDLPDVNEETRNYFKNLTVGQFLCLANTAKNFEAYGISGGNQQTWYNILTCWISHYSETSFNVAALRATHKRRLQHFLELQKRYNSRGAAIVKDILVDYLDSAVSLPKQSASKPQVTGSLPKQSTSKPQVTGELATLVPESTLTPVTPAWPVLYSETDSRRVQKKVQRKESKNLYLLFAMAVQ